MPDRDKRLATIEAALAAHEAKFLERQRAEEQAQTERQLAAAAVQTALQEAALASAKALEAALNNANELERERVARVRDEVKEVKAAADAAVRSAGIAQNKFEDGVKERFEQVNEFRGSLEDLGKSMGTRRELEQAQDAFRGAHDSLQKEVNDLRSRVDVGPAELRKLASRADQGLGADRAEQQAANARLAIFGVMATFFGGSVFVAILHAVGAF